MSDLTIQQVYDAFSEEQKHVVHLLVGTALQEDEKTAMILAAHNSIYQGLSKGEKTVVLYLIKQAMFGGERA